MKSMDSTSSAIDQQLSVIESVVGDGADLDGYSTLMRRGVNLTTILLADALAEGDSISDAGSASVGNIVSAVLSARGFLRGDSESAVNRITEATTLMDVFSKVLLDGAYARQSIDTSTTIGLGQVNWLRPIVVESAEVEVYTELYYQDDALVFRIYTLGIDGQALDHCQGNVLTGSIIDLERKDIGAIKSSLLSEKTGKSCYDSFSDIGIDYGASFQGSRPPPGWGIRSCRA